MLVGVAVCADILQDGSVSVSRHVNAVTEIMVDETHPKPERNAALTIFFGRRGESVWEIARQYSTSMEAVMEENSLTCERLEENRMLMIPGITRGTGKV